MLSKKIRKEIIITNLKSILGSKDFNIKNVGSDDIEYFLEKEDSIHSIYFNFMDVGDIYVSGFLISINEIEEIILEVGIPNINLLTYQKKENYLTTIKDSFFLDLFSRKYRYYNFKNEDEFEEFSKWLENYILIDGFPFLEHYSFLPNILAKVDQLITEEKYWSEIISGDAKNLFRGIIISKLCNDSNFNEKLSYVDKIFYDDPDEWLPYYEKLKNRLKTLNPKYNANEGSVFKYKTD